MNKRLLIDETLTIVEVEAASVTEAFRQFALHFFRAVVAQNVARTDGMAMSPRLMQHYAEIIGLLEGGRPLCDIIAADMRSRLRQDEDLWDFAAEQYCRAVPAPEVDINDFRTEWINAYMHYMRQTPDAQTDFDAGIEMFQNAIRYAFFEVNQPTTIKRLRKMWDFPHPVIETARGNVNGMYPFAQSTYWIEEMAYFRLAEAALAEA
jgi:hypothetical protein